MNDLDIVGLKQHAGPRDALTAAATLVAVE